MLILRVTRLILAAYVLVLFAMVVPSHTRGIVTVPGTEASVESSCCHPSSANGDRNKPTKEQEKRCAVCFFASSVSTPITYLVDVRPIDCVAIAERIPVAQVLSDEFPNPYWPTGPPAAL